MRAINWSNVHCTGHYSRPVRDLDTRNNPADMAAVVARDGFAWPGGYELVLVTEDGGTLCHNCVRAEYDQVYGEAIQSGNGSGWKPAGVGIIGHNMEGRVDCDHCGRMIADDEDDTEEMDDFNANLGVCPVCRLEMDARNRCPDGPLCGTDPTDKVTDDDFPAAE